MRPSTVGAASDLEIRYRPRPCENASTIDRHLCGLPRALLKLSHFLTRERCRLCEHLAYAPTTLITFSVMSMPRICITRFML